MGFRRKISLEFIMPIPRLYLNTVNEDLLDNLFSLSLSSIKHFSNSIVILQYTNLQIMGLTKTDQFTDRQNKLASLAKALGHPARIAILDYLLKVDACICGDIVNELPLAQPTVSQHLKELKSAELIKGNVEGNAICYCINEDALDDLQAYFLAIAEKMRMKKSKCC